MEDLVGRKKPRRSSALHECDREVATNAVTSQHDPWMRRVDGQPPFRTVGKMGIDATRKSRHDPADFERAWPINWGKVRLEDYL